MNQSKTVGMPHFPWPAGDPYIAYERWRAEKGPVYWDETAQAWLVLGYKPARDILASNDWSSEPLASPAVQEQALLVGVDHQIFDQFMLFVDPPKHTKLRDPLRQVFTARYIRQLSAGVEAVVRDTIGPIPTGHSFDLMSQIATPLPVAVMAEWFDLPVDGAPLLRQETPPLVRILDGQLDPHAMGPAAAALTALIAHFVPIALRRRNTPGDDLLSIIAADNDLDLEEVVMTAILLAIVGQDATTNLIGSGLVRLLSTAADGSKPIDWIDFSDPAQVSALIKELLRLESPSQGFGRTASREQVICGHTIRPGDRAFIVIGAANRDPDVYDEPDVFRLDRVSEPDNLGFGFGRHRCLGAELARLEAGTALRQLAQRRPSLDGDVEWRDTPLFRGPHTVTVRFAQDLPAG